ncbi:hypothetical protein [Dongia sp.]|uniref:hypothetical protein n=1 Tax=Dongia sp. TaxID=1977262 RepID=UPI0035ADA2CD
MIGSIESLSDRLMRRFLLLVLAACLGLGALGVGAAALYQWLLLWVMPAAALGLVALALALLATGAGILALRGRKALPANAPLSAGETGPAARLMATAGDIAGDVVRADPLGAVLGAGALGFILEGRPDLEQALVGQFLRQLRLER